MTRDGEPCEIRERLETILGIPFTRGNRVDVLRNGVQIFPAMLEAIEGARFRIEFLTYVYWRGPIAERFAHALVERARAGIDVKVLLDAVGSKWMSETLLDAMRDAGVRLEWFRPLARWKVWEADNRTHRKVLIVDGLVAFTGGVGIAEEWEGDARNEHEWRDTHFRIHGPAVRGLQGAFFSNWAETGNRILDPVDVLPEQEPAGQSSVQVVRASASTGWSDIATLIGLLISSARTRLRISSAYFVPDEITISNLCSAVASGVEVDVMVPGRHTDERISQLAGEAEFKDLLDGGVRLWKYQRTMLHNKIITVDGVAACIGSANFNQRSMRKDDEVSTVVIDRDLVRVLDDHFADDLAHCEQIETGTWKKRGHIQRLMEAVVMPFKSHT